MKGSRGELPMKGRNEGEIKMKVDVIYEEDVVKVLEKMENGNLLGQRDLQFSFYKMKKWLWLNGSEGYLVCALII